MSKSLPPLTWFRAFEAAARHLSFTLAADELGFTQSAISQHVRALEDRLGCQLFVRANRSLQLTDAGRLLVPDVTAAMSLLTQAVRRFLPDGDRAKLTIATSASIAHFVIVPQIATFTARHPNIALQLITTIWPDDFAATNADIEIRFGAPGVVGGGASLLEPSHLHVVAAPEVADTLPKSVHLADLRAFPLIQAVGLSTGWTSLSRQHKLAEALETDLYVDTHGMAVDLAIAGAGVALTHCQITRNAIQHGDLCEIALPHVPAEEGYYVALKATALPEQQQQFVEWFLEVTRPSPVLGG
ncbi:LysR family transcriptional regulator [uncultured Roseobacter sp.]|uniref:LysR family transcriptional regulator n=1 Tax=uncultured Roseobacter sp. TaxID=114847 RepID=UPI0026070A1F|nr:LysR family transcriptional regulator [uncultured Roseobacter sp.]